MNQSVFLRKVFPFSIFLILIFNSCIKDTISEIGNMKGIEVNPTLSIPLLNAHLGIKDIYSSYSNKAQIVEGSDKFLTFIYETHDSLNQKPLITIPIIDIGYTLSMNQNEINQFIALGTFSASYNGTASVTVNNKERLRKANIKTGNFFITITSNFKHNGYVVFNYPSLTKNGVVIFDTVHFYYTGTSPVIITKQIDISGCDIDLTNNGSSYNTIPYTLTANVTRIPGNPVFLSDQVVIDEKMNIQDYNFLEGYLGKFTVLNTTSSEVLDVFDKNADGNVLIYNPILRIKILNGVGLPITATVSNTSIITGKGLVYPININQFKDTITFAYPTISQKGQVIESDYIIDKTNSNIDSVYSHSPQYLNYTLNFTANINEDVTKDNFIFGSNNPFTSIITNELPLEIKVFSYKIHSLDTIVWPAMPDGVDVNWVKLSGWYKNTFPLGSTIQVYFTKDSVINGIDTISIVDSLYSQPFYISGAVVDANGKLIQPSVTTNEVMIGIAKYNRLKTITTKTYIVDYVRTSDYNGAFPFVKIYSDQGLDFKLGVEANGTYKFKLK